MLVSSLIVSFVCKHGLDPYRNLSPSPNLDPKKLNLSLNLEAKNERTRTIRKRELQEWKETSQNANPSYQNRIMTETIRQPQFIIVLIYRSSSKLSTTERKQSESENCKEKQNNPKKANPSYRNKEGRKGKKWVQSSIPGMAS